MREWLAAALRKLRPDPERPWTAADERRRTAADDAREAKIDARTHDMIKGKGLDAQGNVIDFESDSERPRRY